MVYFSSNQMFSILLWLLSLSLFTNAYSQENHELNSLFSTFNKAVKTNFSKAEQVALKGLRLSKVDKNSNHVFRSYNNLIQVYTAIRKIDKAKFYIEEALLIEENVSNKSLKVDLYNAISYIETLDYNFNKALKFSEKSIFVSNQIKDSLKLCESYINSADLLIDRQEEKAATKRLNYTCEIAQRHNYNGVLSKAYFSLAEINYDKQKDSTLYFYNEALKYAYLDNNKSKQGSIYADLAFFYTFNQDFSKVPSLIEKAKTISEAVGNKKTLHAIYYTLGWYNENLGDYKSAIKHYKKAITDYGDYVTPIQLSNAYIMTSSGLFHNKQYKDAYQYQERYLILSDSLFNLKKTKEFDVLRTEYEVEKKNNQITLLEKDSEIKTARQKLIIISSLILILPLILLFLFYKHRANAQRKIREQEKVIHSKEKQRLQKERELVEVKALIEGQDKERHRIAKELHDGVGGQLASVKMGLSHINSNLNNSEITAIDNTLSKTFSELRALSHSLSSNYLKERTLDSLIGELKFQYENSNIFNVEVSIFPEDCLSNLELNIKHNLYRIIQELLTNCNKYAHADLVQIAFNLHDAVLIMLYEDNGIGFDLEQQKIGVGLKNIKERVQSINGKINIESTSNIGTQIIVETTVNVSNRLTKQANYEYY